MDFMRYICPNSSAIKTRAINVTLSALRHKALFKEQHHMAVPRSSGKKRTTEICVEAFNDNEGILILLLLGQ